VRVFLLNLLILLGEKSEAKLIVRKENTMKSPNLIQRLVWDCHWLSSPSRSLWYLIDI